jgi:hypothetical protein
MFCNASLRKYCTYLANELSIQALYLEYYGDQQGALKNFLQCGNWKKAHTISMTSVAHSLFLSCKFSFNAVKKINKGLDSMYNLSSTKIFSCA